MQSRSLISLISFYFLLCIPSFARSEASIKNTDNFEFHYALKSVTEISEFENRIKPQMEAFIQHWENHSLFPENKPIRIYIEPDPEFSKTQAFQLLYGENFKDVLDNFIKEVRSKTTKESLVEYIQQFACKYPPLWMNYLAPFPWLHFWKEEELTLDNLRENAENWYSKFSSENGKIPRLHANFYANVNQPRCDFIVYARSEDLNYHNHSFLDEGVVLHELSHWLHVRKLYSGLVSSKFLSSTLNETVADVMAHIFLNNPCHTILDPGKETERCNRDLSKHQDTFTTKLWKESDVHRRGEAISHFLWDLYKEIGKNNFSIYLSGAIKELFSELKEFNSLILGDFFLRKRETYINDFNLMSSFVHLTCKTESNTCQNLNNYIGTAEEEIDRQLSNLFLYAPTTIGENGTRFSVNGEEVYLQFFMPKNNLGEIRAVVTINGQAKVYNDCSWQEIQFKDLVSFSQIQCKNSDEYITWNSNGEFEFRTTDSLKIHKFENKKGEYKTFQTLPWE